MTYAQGSLIEAADINGFLATNVNNFNGIWAVGATNKGYGQTSINQVAVGDLVAALTWNSLVTNVKKSADHQGTAITAITAPTTGNLVEFFAALSTNINSVITNRLNAAAQAPTSTTSSTCNVTWSAVLTYTITVNWGNHDTARYFFNAGGQLGINSSHPNGSGINALINDICNEAGTVWMSSPTSGTVSLAGTSYSGVTKVGGGYLAGTTTNTDWGFYNWTSATTQISKQLGDYSYHSYTAGTFRTINISYNNAGTATITVVFDEVPNGATVSTGTVTNLIVRPPSSAHLTNTWGTPSVSISVAAS